VRHFDYPIIDAHAHPYFKRNFSLDAPNNWEEYFSPLDEFGIDYFCGACNIRTDGRDFAVIAECNERVLTIQRQFPHRYYPGVNIHPNFPEESCREVQRFYDLGFRWVGEIAGYVMGYQDYCSPGMFTILELVRDLGLTLNIHPSSIDDMQRLLQNFPTLPVVIAHPGPGDAAREKIALLRQYPNAYLDLSGGGILGYGILRAILNAAGKGRLLFGTDYPVCNPACYLYGVLGEKLRPEENRAIFHDNFLALTGWQLPRQPSLN